MKLKIVIDCGTTNTKLHIVEEVICKKSRYIHMGIKDLFSEEQKILLKKKILSALEEELKEMGRSLNDIEYLIGFGMLTSELGFFDVPHIEAPASIEKIQENLCFIKDDFFPHIPILLIPGIKNASLSEKSALEALLEADFMRGEETQIIGLMNIYQPQSAFNIFILSSHTKLVHVNEAQEIDFSYTTACGQLCQAIQENTSIGKSLKDDGKPSLIKEEDIFSLAKKVSQEQGFLRGVMFPRFLDVFAETNAKDRKSFLSALTCFEDLKILEQIRQKNIDLNIPYFLIGYQDHVDIFEKILKQLIHMPNLEIYKITTDQQKAELSVAGAISLIKK